MIVTISILGLAFIWLLKETDYMRVQLPVGIMIKHNPIDTPYYWMTPEAKESHLMICHNNWGCPYKSKCQKVARWTSWKIPTRTVKAFGSTFNLVEGCNIARAKLLKSIAREVKRKPTAITATQQRLKFVEDVRVGSHREWIETTPNHGFHRIVEEYTTKFYDCLPSRQWLKEHYQDSRIEPTIEIKVDGQLKLSLNGDYKRSIIKDMMRQYCRPGEGKPIENNKEE